MFALFANTLIPLLARHSSKNAQISSNISTYEIIKPCLTSFWSGITKKFSCIRSSWNFGIGQYLWSFLFVSSPLLWKNRINRYSLKIGPMEPLGGQSIFSIRSGMIGLFKFTDKLTCNENEHGFFIFVLWVRSRIWLYLFLTTSKRRKRECLDSQTEL